MDHHSGNPRRICDFSPRLSPCAEAVLPVLGPARASDRFALPQNASIHASADRAAKLDAVLSKDPDVERWSTYVGRGAIRFYLPLSVELPNDFFSQFVVIAKDIAARERLRSKLEHVLQEEFPGAVSRIVPLELGPPVGWPVQYREFLLQNMFELAAE